MAQNVRNRLGQAAMLERPLALSHRSARRHGRSVPATRHVDTS